MKQEDSWQKQYADIIRFMETNKRCPSKHRIEEHRMLNWIKYNKKQTAKGKLPPHRTEQFSQLLLTAQKYQRLNQYAYRRQPPTAETD